MKRRLIVTTSWDDGSIYDLKLAGLLAKYKIPATFYLTARESKKTLNSPQIKSLSKDFEIGSHGLRHTNLASVSIKKAAKEVKLSKEKLESVIGKKIRSFAYPYGKHTQVIKQEIGLMGFEYARTTSLFSLSIGDKLLAPTTVHVYPHHPLLLLKEGISRKLFYDLAIMGKITVDWEKLAIHTFEMARDRGVFHLWGHSWEIQENGDWQKLENVFKHISQNSQFLERKSNVEVLDSLSTTKRDYYNKKISEDSVNKRLVSTLEDFDRTGRKVLDIGCGDGVYSTVFKKAEYLGIDQSTSQIRRAKKRFPGKNLNFLVGDSHNNKLIGRTKYDLILIVGILEDSVNPLEDIYFLSKLSKKKGKIVVTLHDASNIYFKIKELIRQEMVGRIFPFTSFTSNFISKKFSKKDLVLKKIDHDLRGDLVLVFEKI